MWQYARAPAKHLVKPSSSSSSSRTSETPDVVRSAVLRKDLGLLQLLVDFTLGGVLEDEVDAALVVEVAVEPQDVVVPQVGLNLDLSPELVLYLGLGELIAMSN